MKYFLFTEVHDVEGTFGGSESYDTQEEALAAAVEFEKTYMLPEGKEPNPGAPGWEWRIIEGTEILKGGDKWSV